MDKIAIAWGALKGYKTYITAGIAVITALGAYATGDATLMQTLQLLFTAVMGATVRNAVG